MLAVYSSIAWASQPAVLATAKMASPAPRIIPAQLASTASAKSMFGSGRARRCISASTASTTASRGDAGTALLTMASEQTGPRITAAVDEVAKAGNPLTAAEQFAHHAGRGRRVLGRGQHGLRAQGRAAVQGPPDRA